MLLHEKAFMQNIVKLGLKKFCACFYHPANILLKCMNYCAPEQLRCSTLKRNELKLIFPWRKINCHVLQIAKTCFRYTIWCMISEKSITNCTSPPVVVHVVAVRGLIHQEVSTKVRQRGEFNWALQLKPSGQQISSTIMSRPESILARQD